jgi:hypothetical protein
MNTAKRGISLGDERGYLSHERCSLRHIAHAGEVVAPDAKLFRRVTRFSSSKTAKLQNWRQNIGCRQ